MKFQKVASLSFISESEEYMTKETLIDTVMQVAEAESRPQTKAVVDAVFESITKTLSRGEDVAITGFGTFSVAKYAARMGVNPKTGERIQIAASTRPKFKAGKSLKDAVK